MSFAYNLLYSFAFPPRSPLFPSCVTCSFFPPRSLTLSSALSSACCAVSAYYCPCPSLLLVLAPPSPTCKSLSLSPLRSHSASLSPSPSWPLRARRCCCWLLLLLLACCLAITPTTQAPNGHRRHDHSGSTTPRHRFFSSSCLCLPPHGLTFDSKTRTSLVSSTLIAISYLLFRLLHARFDRIDLTNGRRRRLKDGTDSEDRVTKQRKKWWKYR